VKAYLLKLGVEGGRIRTISYGKELPVDTGKAEDAWARNRRAHFKLDRKG
jgi:peptidoglycan-associated lipoprotein